WMRRRVAGCPSRATASTPTFVCTHAEKGSPRAGMEAWNEAARRGGGRGVHPRAAGLSGPPHATSRAEGRTTTSRTEARPAGARGEGVVHVQRKAETAEPRPAAEGRNLREISEEIDKGLKPGSFPLTKLTVELEVDVRQDMKTVHNVAAYLPGETAEYVVIGAHYDHLGLGDENSLAPSQVGTIHPGADDNASGTA